MKNTPRLLTVKTTKNSIPDRLSVKFGEELLQSPRRSQLCSIALIVHTGNLTIREEENCFSSRAEDRPRHVSGPARPGGHDRGVRRERRGRASTEDRVVPQRRAPELQ